MTKGRIFETTDEYVIQSDAGIGLLPCEFMEVSEMKEATMPTEYTGYTLPEGFVPELGCTVRTCLGCGSLVSGGPTRCVWCAELSGRSRFKRKLIKWLIGL